MPHAPVGEKVILVLLSHPLRHAPICHPQPQQTLEGIQLVLARTSVCRCCWQEWQDVVLTVLNQHRQASAVEIKIANQHQTRFQLVQIWMQRRLRICQGSKVKM